MADYATNNRQALGLALLLAEECTK